MNCLCCGKPILEPMSSSERDSHWHKSCTKKFFGVENVNEIELSNDSLESLVQKTIEKGFTIAGVQKKLSLHLSKERKDSRLTLVGYPSGYILKPQTHQYPYLPEAEYLVMQMAKQTGIQTVPFALIRIKGKDEFAYITKRIDRTNDGQKLAMEDFCQLDQRLTVDKYKGSYERVGKIVREYSSQPQIDLAELYFRILFSFATGNSDMHLKNFSLIETKPNSGIYRLSEAYDLLPTNLIIQSDKDQMALTLNGKNRNLRKKDFLRLAQNYGLQPNAAEKMISFIIHKKDQYLSMCNDSYLPKEWKEQFCDLITERCSILEGQKD